MEVIVFLLTICAILWLVIKILQMWCDGKRLVRNFNRCNVIVYGKKGTGKDLLFQYVINKRKKEYYSNISYGGKYNNFSPINLELGTNDYNNFIHNNINVLDKSQYDYENKDIYFSDCGIILPCQYDNILYKTYKGFPLSYALSRHLWHNNIHCNTQNLDRVWKALREQADYYVRTIETFSFCGFLFVRFITYDRYQSARDMVQPIPKRAFNKMNKSDIDNFIALNGEVKKGCIIIPKWKVKYDSRAYHSIVFGEKAK